MAEKEAGGIISVGGLVSQLASPPAGPVPGATGHGIPGPEQLAEWRRRWDAVVSATEEYERNADDPKATLKPRLEALKRWSEVSGEAIPALFAASRQAADLAASWSKENEAIVQILGRALGYPRFADDQKNFPGATDADGVAVAEYTAGTIAEEAAERIAALRSQAADLADRLAERQRFKDWVHAYLDSHGVPHHPPGTHGAEGCRIGDRMDWLMAELAKWKRAHAVELLAHAEAATDRDEFKKKLDDAMAFLSEWPNLDKAEAIAARRAAENDRNIWKQRAEAAHAAQTDDARALGDMRVARDAAVAGERKARADVERMTENFRCISADLDAAKERVKKLEAALLAGGGGEDKE